MGREYPKAVVCRVLGTARSSHYYEPKLVDKSRLEEEIRKICAEFPRYGYRRVTAELKRRSWRVNRKHAARLMTKLNLQAKKPAKRKCRTTDSDHPYPRCPNLVKDLQVEYPDQVWVADTLAPACKCRCHLYPSTERVCLSRGFDGCLYPLYSRLAFGLVAGSDAHTRGFAQGA